MTLYSKIAANTLVQVLGRFITSGITFLITILIASRFGPTGFGDFIKITTFVGFFYIIADFGANAIFLRDFKAEDFKKLLFLRIIFAGILILVAIIIPLALPYHDSQGFTPYVRAGIFLFSFTILAQAILTTCNAIFQKTMRYDKSVLAASLGQIITLAAALLLIKTNSLNAILLAFLIGGAFMATAAIILVKRESFSIFPKLDKNFIKKIAITTFPLGLTLVFNLIYFRADTFLLALSRPTPEVGIYGLAFKFFEFPLSIATFFGNSIYPVFLYNKKREILTNLIMKSSVLLLIVSIVLIIFLWFAAPLITIVNKDFALSIIPFRILILSLPLFFLSSLIQWALISRGRQKVLALVYFLSMVLNIFLNLLFIPSFSFIASSIITGVSEALVLLLLLLILVRS